MDRIINFLVVKPKLRKTGILLRIERIWKWKFEKLPGAIGIDNFSRDLGAPVGRYISNIFWLYKISL